MKNRLLYLLFIATFFSVVSCSSDDAAIVDQPEVLVAKSILNVPYGSDPQQVYDIYLPEGRTSETTKVLILIHGGGWIGGDKTDMASYVPTLQEKNPGYAIVNMNYVLATTSQPAFPNQILDVGRVIDQLTSNKEELHISPEFGLIGASAGAHLALMYDYVHDTDDQVKMVCDIVGPTDFSHPFYVENYPNFDLLISVLVDESAYPEGADYIELLSPAMHVSSASSPTILFYGNQDPLVPLANGTLLNAELDTAGIPHSFTVYDGGHANWDTASFTDLETKLSAFIAEYFGV